MSILQETIEHRQQRQSGRLIATGEVALSRDESPDGGFGGSALISPDKHGHSPGHTHVHEGQLVP
jgi:hypothetical protein